MKKIKKLLRLALFQFTDFLKLAFFRFPEGKLKNKIRLLSFRRVNSLAPIMKVNVGERVILVGTPNPKTIRDYRFLVGSDGIVIVLEPDPRNANTLKSYIKETNWENVHLVEKAAWSKEEVVKFKVNINPDDNKVPIDRIVHDNDLDPDRKYVDEIEVEAIPLDKVWEEFGDVDYVEITVNGAELEVLKGAKKLLNSASPRVWSKGHALLNGKPLNKVIVKFLRYHNYYAIITAPSCGIVENWEKRAGDVYGWNS